jgi:hypothetical protein
VPDPREAVYDVLLAKKRRADEARALAEKARAARHAFAEGTLAAGDDWERYEADNARANAVYNGSQR